LVDAQLTNSGGVALDLSGLETQALVLRPKAPPEGAIDLTHARVRVLDDSEDTWPQTLALHGFIYDAFAEDPKDPKIGVRVRVGWLQRDPGGYAPQPYEQL
jgi:hypothetical protein